MQSEIPHSKLIDFLLLLTSRRRRFRVTGSSMSPLLFDGEEIIIACLPDLIPSLRVDDIVVLVHPLESNLKIVKRIKAIAPNGKKFFVQGDNLFASTDSRHFGWVDENLIIGKVICRFP